ncbi:hypothetical protein BD410DRAFT_804150 [Rickenella mellea]|uniref:Uncharacterized protein n=1 Tax=Rickenella mellea TaxID=50990 RepID=A0A4Y7Q2P0_9AGAM|nr:hypothetical protein BD410DRAFT_804150 [Rickenella mellea]
MSPLPVLLSRTLDPVLGVFTGVFAYYLCENNPRTAPQADHKLAELLKWKWEKWQNLRHNRLRAEGERAALLSFWESHILTSPLYPSLSRTNLWTQNHQATPTMPMSESDLPDTTKHLQPIYLRWEVVTVDQAEAGLPS